MTKEQMFAATDLNVEINRLKIVYDKSRCVETIESDGNLEIMVLAEFVDWPEYRHRLLRKIQSLERKFEEI